MPVPAEVKAHRAAARAFLKSNRHEIRRLRKQAWAFNRALRIQQESAACVQASVDPSVFGAVGDYWSQERERIVGEIDGFIRKLDRAGRDLEACRNLAAARQAYKAEVRQLKELESELGRYSDDGRCNDTRDLSPWVAASQLRERLQARAEELGLPPDALPPAPGCKLQLPEPVRPRLAAKNG